MIFQSNCKFVQIIGQFAKVCLSDVKLLVVEDNLRYSMLTLNDTCNTSEKKSLKARIKNIEKA